MTRLLRAALVAGALLAVGAALAGPPTGRYVSTAVVFTAVDAVTLAGRNLYVRGVVEGEAAPSDWYASFSGSEESLPACQQAALAAMAKPGAYCFELGSTATYSGYGYCRLSRTQP